MESWEEIAISQALRLGQFWHACNMPLTAHRHVNVKPLKIGINWRKFVPFHPLDLQKTVNFKGDEFQPDWNYSSAEPGEMRVADLRAEAIRSFVASAGVVHRDPGSTEEPGPQHIAGLIAEAVLAIDQQAHDLTLGDDDPEPAQQRHQTWHRRLPLMILGEHEAAQFRPEVTIDAGRQRRRHHAAIRRLPAFAAEIHNMRTDHQILHHEARVAFEA